MKARTEDNLRLAHALRQAIPRVEVFTFGTRLTRVTRPLRLKRREQALARAAQLVSDWDGGTRIGDALQGVPRRAALRRLCARRCHPRSSRTGSSAAIPPRCADAVAQAVAPRLAVSWLTPLAVGRDFRPQTEALIAISPLCR